MEAGTTTFSDFIQSTKLTIAHILTAFFSSALGARAQSFLEAEAKKVSTKPDDPRFLVNVIAKRWKQDFESQIPSSSPLPSHFEEVRNLFNIDAHSGQESWLKINYYVENLFAGLQMLSSFPRPYHVDTATALISLKSLWNRVDRSGNALNSDFKWEARLQDVYLPGLESEELTVIISQVADSVTSDQVETAISITLGISSASCKKLPDGTFEVSFASAKDLNECFSHSLRIKNMPASVSKKQMPREVKYVIGNMPTDIPLELIKSGIELNLDCSVSAITKHANGDWEVVFGNEMAFEKEEVVIRKQKILLERKNFSASVAQTKILVYGPLNDYDNHKIEGVLDNILDVKCNAAKSEDDGELAVLLLSREIDSATVLEHDNKNLIEVAKNAWYFEPYCEHVLKVVKIPLGAKTEHISSALAKTALDCKLVYYDDKQRLGYVHCTSKESKDKLLMQGTLPLLKTGSPAMKHDVVAPKEVIKPDPLPVAKVNGVTASFKDSNEFVEVVSGNGVTNISFNHKGDLSRIQAKGFSHISTICDAKGIKCTIIDGFNMQLSTAIPNDVKEVMAAIQFQLKDRKTDCVTVGEVDRIYTPIFRLMAKRLTNCTNCVVTIGAKPGNLNNQMDFIQIFLFGFKTDIAGLKQLLSTMKRPISQDIDISDDDAKLLADMPEALDAIKEEYFADFVFTNKVTLRALSLQCRDQAWQAALAEIKQRKEATKLNSSYCFVDFFDNYMRSDFQKDMFQKQLGGVSIMTRGNKFIFNGPHSVVDKVKTELQGRLAGLTSKPWPEKIDADLARHVFSTKKVQQILRENEVGYSFVGKRRYNQTTKKQENGGKKQPFDRVNNNPSPTKPRNKEKREGQKSNAKKSSSQIKTSNNNIKKKNHKNKKDNEASDTQTRYYNQQVVLTEISFACQDANKLANCLNQLKPILQIQSVPLDVNFRVTKFIIQNINDIESKYKVIIRKKPYANIASASSDESDSDSDSGSNSDDSSMSDAHSTASSDAFSDAPKRLPNQCYITGMARNTIKAINYIKEYEKNQSWRQSLKLPALRFRFFETFKKDEVTMLCKKYNLKAVWPVHSVKLASSPSTSNKSNQRKPINTAVRRNELSVEGKKGDVEAFMQQMNLIAQGLFEESIQIPSTIPARILHLEKDDLMSQFSVVITVIQAKSATNTSADICDNDSDDDEGDVVQNQLQHTVIVVGSDAKVVSNACKTMSGPYETFEPKYTPQQFSVLFKELVIQKTINSFQSENTVHIRLDKTSLNVTLCGRRANIDAALNSLQVRLNGKFLVETITIAPDFDILMRQKNKSLFNASQQGAKVFLQKDDKTKLNISGDRNNVIVLKGKLEALLADIKKDLHTETNSSYAWRAALATDFSKDLMHKTNVILSASKEEPKSYDRASVHLTNGAVIHLKRGDIFNETGSAIVSCDNEDMKPMGGIAKLIADRAGPAMVNQVATYLSQFGKLRVGAAMTTGAGNLSASFTNVIHVVGPVWSGGNANEHNLLSSAVRAVIDQAEKGQMTKVVMPSISTGVFGYPKKLAAESITKELVQSMTYYASFLKELVLIDTDNEMIEEFCTQFYSLHSNVSTISYVEAKNQWYWLEDNGVYMPYDPDQNNQIELAFQTNQPSVTVVGDLNQVKNGSNYEVNFKTMQQRNFVTNWLRNVWCEHLPPNRWVKLEAPSLQASTGLVKKIHIHQIPPSSEVVKITGARKDVTLAIQEINKHIAAMTKRAEMDWHGGALDPSQVQYLESIGVKHSIDKRKLILEGFFDTLDKAQLFLMKHSIYQAVKYPDHWDDQSHNCQLFVVDLNSQEGATVSAAFKTTMPNAQIVKVERVQNKLVWEDFTTSVQKLRKTSGNTTQLQLFHGTRNTDPKLIYTDEVGFRNQFSSPQCYWGYGNYFAVNSSYSHNYAHYLPNGLKQMFMATVLVGDPYQAGTQTDSSLKVPPFKPSGDQRYDSVQGFTNGSTVYILYENGRAYPSYLITYNY